MKIDKKTSIYIFVFSLLAFYLGNRVSSIFVKLEGLNILERFDKSLVNLIPSLGKNLFYISGSRGPLITGFILFIIVWLIFVYNSTGKKNYMQGAEHGTSRWGTRRDIKPLINSISDLNIPLSETESISVDKVKNFEADRNKNIVVIGGSGSGKSYSQIKPSLMQLHSSYVITDPKGTLLPETGHMFD